MAYVVAKCYHVPPPNTHAHVHQVIENLTHCKQSLHTHRCEEFHIVQNMDATIHTSPLIGNLIIIEVN